VNKFLEFLIDLFDESNASLMEKCLSPFVWMGAGFTFGIALIVLVTVIMKTGL